MSFSFLAAGSHAEEEEIEFETEPQFDILFFRTENAEGEGGSHFPRSLSAFTFRVHFPRLRSVFLSFGVFRGGISRSSMISTDPGGAVPQVKGLPQDASSTRSVSRRVPPLSDTLSQPRSGS